MKFLYHLHFRNRRISNPRAINRAEAADRPLDDGLISLSYGGEGTAEGEYVDEDEDEYVTAASSSSSQGRRCGDEITVTGERSAETEDTASSGEDRMTAVDADSEKELLRGAASAVTGLNVGDAEVRRSADSPPTDDCCPICFGAFAIPVRAPCGHWYCGGCILQYWNYGAALQPCKCPMCSQRITNLMPEASLGTQQEAEISEVLKNVQRYNRLFVGGVYGFFLKLFELPLYIKRVLQDMINPDRPGAHLNKLRIFAMLLGVLYTFSPFDFLRIGRQNVVDLFDHSAMVLSLVLYMIGLYLRRRRFQRVREMAAVQL